MNPNPPYLGNEQRWQNSVQYVLFLILAAVIWLPQSFANAVLVVVMFGSLVAFKKQIFVQNWRAILISIGVYLVALGSYFYTTDKTEATFVLEKQLSLFLLPLLFGSSIVFTKKQVNSILAAFVISITAACLYLLYVFYKDYKVHAITGGLEEFLNTHLHHNFSSPILMHATFLSMYVCFALALCCYWMYLEKGVLRLLSVPALPVLVISLILLSSRIIVIPFIIVVAVVLPFYLSRYKLLLHFVLLGIVFFIGMRYLVKSTALEARFKTDTLRELNLQVDSLQKVNFDTINTNDATRAERWACAVELIREQPLLGYGTGDEKKRLNEKYEKYKLSNSILSKFDAHNQYLAFAIKSGVFGVLSFFGLLLFGFLKAVKSKNYPLLALMLIIGTAALTENVLESNKGIVFFAFFYSLLLFSRISEHKPEKP